MSKNLQTHFTITTEYMFNFRRAASSHSEDTGKTDSVSPTIFWDVEGIPERFPRLHSQLHIITQHSWHQLGRGGSFPLPAGNVTVDATGCPLIQFWHCLPGGGIQPLRMKAQSPRLSSQEADFDLCLWPVIPDFSLGLKESAWGARELSETLPGWL